MTIQAFIKKKCIGIYNVFHFVGETIQSAFRKPVYIYEIIDTMDYTGPATLAITAMISLFIGMALTLQIIAEFTILGLQMYTGRVVGISIITEIGPVASALVFAGRVGSGMASEIGSMVLRHQIDILRVFGVNPLQKLIAPRFLSAIVMLPVLTIIGDIIGLFGGYYIFTFINHQSSAVYWDSIRVIMIPRYILSGSVKPFIFGGLIAVCSCYMGFKTKGGAAGLRNATTNAFVYSTMTIILADFLITKIILILFGLAL